MSKITVKTTAKFIRNLESGSRQVIVAYGTSLTQNAAWVNQLQEFLEEKYPGLSSIINSGQGAMWSDWGVKNLDIRVLKFNPDATFIEFSINDAFLPYKTLPEATHHNLNDMIDRIFKKNPRCEIILMVMNPPTGKYLTERPRIEEYNQVYWDVVKKRKLLLIDHYPNWKAILDKNRMLFDKYVSDGLHPAEMGCKKVIIPAILKTLFGR